MTTISDVRKMAGHSRANAAQDRAGSVVDDMRKQTGGGSAKAAGVGGNDARCNPAPKGGRGIRPKHMQLLEKLYAEKAGKGGEVWVDKAEAEEFFTALRERKKQEDN